MKSFLKYTLATIVGVLIVNVLLFFLFFGILGAVASFSEKTVEVKDNSVLVMKLNHEIVDRSSSNPFDNFDFFSLQPTTTLGLNKILSGIKKAAKDDRIKGIYMDLTDIQSNFGGLGTIQEIRKALTEFKESGKFVYSYTGLGYSQKSYYLATAADSIFINPATSFLFMGMGGNTFFYKDLLDKIGIKAEIIKVGKYKSAVEPFTQTEMSPANRQQIEVYLKSLWGNILNAISETRHIPVDTLNAIADRFKFRTPEEATKEGFFDGVIYEDQMLALLKNKCGLKADAALNGIAISDYQKAALPVKAEFIKDKLAVIYATGAIGLTQNNTEIGPELAQSVRKAREDKNIKGIVLRVNSPGGSALVSDIIWREVQLAAQTKPLIVSMGNVAASGGYYISCAADTIVADPTTLTGSIGIYGQFFTGEKLIKDKLGITSSVVKTNAHSDFGGGSLPFLPFIGDRPFTAYEKNVLQNYIELGYETFLNRVATGRHMTRDQVHEIAQGRVWTGEDALKIGLVDVLGGLEDAVKIAAQKAGIEKYRIVEYPAEKDFFEQFMNNFSASVKTKMMKNEMGNYYETFRTLQKALSQPEGWMARIPYDLTID